MTSYPYVTIDLRHRMIAVRLSDEPVAWTEKLDDAHLVDVDATGRVVAIDVMTLDDLKIDEMAAEFGFSDSADAIKAAIDAVIRPSTAASYGVPLIVQGKPVSDVAVDVQTEEPRTRTAVPPIVV